MKIVVRDPGSGVQLELEARREKKEDKTGWQIALADGKHIFIYKKDGAWAPAGGHPAADDELIRAIGRCITDEHTLF